MTHRLSRSIRSFLLALAFIGPFAHAQDEAVVRNGDVVYVSGGVGEDSRAHLNAMRDFNLKLVMALASGAYVSGVKVEVDSASGKPLIQAVSEGPVFLAQLPAGQYKVSAALGDKRFEHKITVARGKQSVLHFRWAAEP